MSDLTALVEAALTRALGALQDGTEEALEPKLRRHCQDAVEWLWQHRTGLVRLLRRTRPAGPAPRPAVVGMRQWTLVDEATVELDIVTGRVTRSLMDAVEGEWRELQLRARIEGDASPWAPSPQACASALRWIAEMAADELPLRLVLIRLGGTALRPGLVAWYSRLTGGTAEEAAAAAVPAEVPAAGAKATAAGPLDAAWTRLIRRSKERAVALPPVAEVECEVECERAVEGGLKAELDAEREGSATPAGLLDSAQPGQWFRMVLHDQWTVARVIWRSDRGHFFMFTSHLAGRSHSLTRNALEDLIRHGKFERADQRQ